mmetsp:Transcript_42633/g.89440  ORF Transcript_42633/g.89440 Transcript_42633/m.89440 type:complete len:211 (-) Transcript_42633:601-1233(-)
MNGQKLELIPDRYVKQTCPITSPLRSFFRSIQLVTSEYSKLQGAIDDLGSAIGGTLGRQKEDLQRTNKTEMRKVQVEIENLSKDKTRLEESIATNERACQLETERDWYRKEALHLDEVLEQTRVKQKDLMDRLDESEQDREWMKGQLEKLTTQNWALAKKLKELGVDMSSLCEEDGSGEDSDEQASGKVGEAEDKDEQDKETNNEDGHPE